jgi:hypothetical protein
MKKRYNKNYIFTCRCGTTYDARTVELNRSLSGHDPRNVTLMGGFIELGHCHVEVGDVGVVVLAVMELHDLAADDGLEL